MTRKRVIFTVHDNIRIVNPVFFERCGYPLCLETEASKLTTEKRESIGKFMNDHGIPSSFLEQSAIYNKVFDKIVSALAYGILHHKRFGGRTRSIHTKERPKYKGTTAAIVRMFRCKTGEYVPGRPYSNLDGDEYDPPYLDNEKTHQIFELDLLDEEHRPLKIEVCNVELVD